MQPRYKRRRSISSQGSSTRRPQDIPPKGRPQDMPQDADAGLLEGLEQDADMAASAQQLQKFLQDLKGIDAGDTGRATCALGRLSQSSAIPTSVMFPDDSSFLSCTAHHRDRASDAPSDRCKIKSGAHICRAFSRLRGPHFVGALCVFFLRVLQLRHMCGTCSNCLSCVPLNERTKQPARRT